MHAQLADQLLGVVEHRRAGQREPQRRRHDALGEPAHRLRALGLRVLAVVRLVDARARAARRRASVVAVRGDDLVVEDRDVAASAGPRRGPRRPRRERCGSQLRGLALPVELQRRGADDDRREGAVGLERRERLDRLAEPLLVGEEASARVERVAHARPLERLQLAAEHGRDLGDRLAPRSRARRRIAPAASACSARSSAEHRPRRRASTSTPCSARNASSCSTSHGSIGSARPRSSAPGSSLERRAGVGVPQHVEPQPLAVDAVRERSGARAAAPRRARAPRRSARAGAVEPRRALLAQRLGGLGRQRDEQPAVVAPTAPRAAPRGSVPGARLQRPPAAAVVAGGASTRPTQRRSMAAQPRVDLARSA